MMYVWLIGWVVFFLGLSGALLVGLVGFAVSPRNRSYTFVLAVCLMTAGSCIMIMVTLTAPEAITP